MNTSLAANSLHHLALWSPRPDAVALEHLSPSISLHGLPAIQLAAIAINQPQRQQLARSSVCFFVSQHAVTQLLNQINLDELAAKTLVAIGEKTAACLAEYGLTAAMTAPPPHTSEALLALPTFQALDYQHLAIICGLGGRTLLQQTLADLGKTVYRIPCYQRDMCDLSPQTMIKFISEHSINGVMITSCRVADAVFAALQATNRDFFHYPMFALSQRIGDYLSTLGFTEIIIADAANRQSLHQTIITWWDSR